LEPANERLGERAGQRSGAREPAPGEALVVPFASWVFVATAEQVAVVPIADPERPLADVGAHLADASLVRLVSGPRWRARPLHVDPVLRDLPVVHGVDLGAPARPRAAGEAVVIADPRGDLVAAALEGEQAAAHLGAPLLRGEAASWDAVSRAFRSSDLFYYAGHGRADDDPLRSGLPLAGGARLEAGDVLAFGEAPRVAVLSGCETARGASPSGRLSLAEALVAAGAERVIGTTERVPDASAARFAAALLEADALEPAPFTPRELHAALSQLREAGDASWSRYRMLVP
ncbi:MAG TPA: CHAT domain-containing protein, partial [Polyangiaceae bacterium LLY-WYZ-15_(1-7)]|nr:CHAT domain-containing protein [Polyangiaceae bacterium LLY-WYZ-15_(1-7)]